MTKCLTIRQPWAHLVVSGIKTIENRSWVTSYRGLILIHAAVRADQYDENNMGLTESQIDDMLGHLRGDNYGAIIGAVTLKDIVPVSKVRGSRWAGGPWCWILEDAIKLATPLPCKGQLGLWSPGRDDLKKAVRLIENS